MQTLTTQVAAADSLQEALSKALQTAKTQKHQIIKIEHQDRQLVEEEQWTQREVDQLQKQLDDLGKQQEHIERQRKNLKGQIREVERQRQKIHGRRGQLEKKRSAANTRRMESEQTQRFEESLQKAQVSWNESASHPEGIECRRHARVSVDVPVSLHTEHNFYAGISRNISNGGLFVATYEPIPIGAVLETAIHLANGESLLLKGKVVWQREYSQFTADVSPGVGIQFIDLTEKDRQAIEQFMSGREPLLYEAD